jgi:hypothetical protein
MKFEIGFNDPHLTNETFFEKILGAELVSTGADKYPPFEVYKLEIENFESLERLLKITDDYFDTISNANISFDPPTIYIDL